MDAPVIHAPITPHAVAAARGLKFFFTGVPCKRRHTALRYTSTRHCLRCCKERRAAEYKEQQQAARASRREYYENNRELERLRARDYARANRERISRANKQWRYTNPDKHAARSAAYRAAKSRRTPSWLTPDDLTEIRQFYAFAQQLREETGIDWHVDHILPLRGERISGLHVPNNLRVIPADQNLRKSARYTPHD